MPSDLKSVMSDDDLRPWQVAHDQLAELADVGPFQLVGGDEVAELARFQLACSTWSVTLIAERSTVSPSTSRRSPELAPATLT